MSGRTAAVTITDGEASTLVPVSQGGCVILYNKSELGHALLMPVVLLQYLSQPQHLIQ